jgi:S1-C subfamily serine protease
MERYVMRFPFCLLSLLVLLAVVMPAVADSPGDSVVKIYATQRGPDLFRPWNKCSPTESTGSGVVIDGNCILTNSHVVLYATEIFVQGKEGGDKVEAKIKAIEPGIDLALLTIDKEDFFAKRPPLPRAKKPPQERDAVEVFGYPFGGTTQSVTKGVVSRIEYVPYTPSILGVRVQIDAALNPGNSGGPAMVGGEMIGLAFSRFAFGMAANIGYIIPNEEIEAFLKDPAPRPKLPPVPIQALQNETLRKKLGLDDKTQGILIINSLEPLQRFDILTHVGRHALDNEGQVKVGASLLFNFQYVVPRLAKNGKVPVTVLRSGKIVKLDVPVSRGADLVIRELKGEYPDFFLYGPLAFMAATSQGASQYVRIPNLDLRSPLLQRQNDKPRFPGEELVVVSSPMFRHKCVRGYSDPVGQVVEEINGVKIKNLRHLVEVLSDCKEDFVTFGFAGERAEVLVLSRKDMAEVTREVMEENGISRRGSPELVKLWEHNQDGEQGKAPIPAGESEAEKMFRAMEKKVSEAKSVQGAFESVGQAGEHEFKTKGNFSLAEGNKARFDLVNEVDGRQSKIRVVSDGARVEYAGATQLVLDTRKDFNAHILAGLNRGGIVALDVPPRRVGLPTASGFKLGAKEKVGDRQTQVVDYKLNLADGPGPWSVQVWLDSETHLPLKRVLSRSPGPRVTETYQITLGGQVDRAGQFELPDNK